MVDVIINILWVLTHNPHKNQEVDLLLSPLHHRWRNSSTEGSPSFPTGTSASREFPLCCDLGPLRACKQAHVRHLGIQGWGRSVCGWRCCEKMRGPGDQIWLSGEERQAYHSSVKGDSWVLRSHQEASPDSSLLGRKENYHDLTWKEKHLQAELLASLWVVGSQSPKGNHRLQLRPQDIWFRRPGPWPENLYFNNTLDAALTTGLGNHTCFSSFLINFLF